MSQPRTSHLQTAKCILQYIKGRLGVYLLFRASTPTRLHVYADLDWAKNPDDQRSMIVSCIFLGPNLVTWMAKKQIKPPSPAQVYMS